MQTLRIGMLGAGNMAYAIARGIPREMAQIVVYDVNASACPRFRELGAAVAASPEALLENLDILLLSVKPQNFAEVLPLAGRHASEKTLLLSIAAGVTIRYIESFFDTPRRIVRAMPNTPLSVGEGAVVLAPNELVSDADYALVESLFTPGGLVRRVREEEINRLTSVHGSGPAYVFLFIQSMVEAAKAMGIDGKLALDLSCATLRGAASMAAAGDPSTQELISMVCSKKGTTEEAMRVLHDGNFSGLLADAMAACVRRADELAQ